MRTVKIYFAVIALSAFTAVANAQDPANNNAVNKVLTSYFSLKNDLVADNSAAAKTHATEFASTVKTLQSEKLSNEQQTVWKQNAPRLQIAATRLTEAKDIDTQREYFAVISKNIIDVTKSLKLDTSPMYVQYCPMKKVSWLSEAAAIKNPFYGKQMLTCGQVTETLTTVNK